MQHQGDENLLWESKIESTPGTNMHPSDGTGGSVQVSPSMFTPDMRVLNGNWLQEYATLQQTHQFCPQFFFNTSETVGEFLNNGHARRVYKI